jgi:hypothetical protein
MVMRPGELLVSIMKTTSLGDPKRKGSDEDDDMSTSGLLIITSQRLALAVLVGLLSKRWSVHQTIELSTVRGTEVKRGFRKNYLCVYHMNYGATYTDAYKDFYDIDPATLKGGSPLQLDFAQQMIDQALAHGRLGRR